MAGVEAENVDAGKTSGTSGGGQQTIEMNNLVGDLSDTIKEKLKSLDDALMENTAGDEEQTNEPTIPRVPKELRDKGVLKNFFNPRVVSVGPYHHENPYLMVTEGMKIKLAAVFIKEHEVNKEEVYCRIKMKIEDLRKCYEMDATRDYSEDDLAWMFLIDGCVVLHFIHVIKYKYNIDKRIYEGLEILLAVTDRETFQIDIMFLENQLPYQLLQLIIRSSKESDQRKLEKSIRDFILLMAWNDQPEEKQVPEENQNQALHLLDLLWTNVTYIRTYKRSNVIGWIIKRLFKIIGTPVDILMHFIIRNLLDKIPRLGGTFHLPNLRSIKDLKEAGVELKLSITGSLTDVKFSHGTLHLPVIVVNDAIAFKFLNLMAYETRKRNLFDKSEVYSYVLFLASIIDGPEDVKELRVKGILYNHLDSDERVVHLFKDVRIDDLGVNFVYKYYEILDEIRKHYNNRRYYVWMAQLKTTYFGSPWSMLALVGAIMMLVMAFLQTLYTILSYYKDKK